MIHRYNTDDKDCPCFSTWPGVAGPQCCQRHTRDHYVTTLTTKTVHASVPDQALPVHSVARDTLETIVLQHWRQRLCPYFSTWLPGVAGPQCCRRHARDHCYIGTTLTTWLCPYFSTWLPGVADPQCCQRHGEIHACCLQTDSIALNYQFNLF